VVARLTLTRRAEAPVRFARYDAYANASIADTRRLLRVLEFQLVFVLFKKVLQVLGRSQQTLPLLVVQRYGKTSEAINTDASLLAHFEFEPSGFLGTRLLFELGNTGQQFLSRRFGHRCSFLYRLTLQQFECNCRSAAPKPPAAPYPYLEPCHETGSRKT